MVEPALAAIGAAIGAVLLYYVIGSQWLGPDDEFWRPIRRTVLPALDWIFAKAFGGFAVNRSLEREHVGPIAHAVADVEKWVAYELGADRNPWAGLKESPDGRTEWSSWAVREVTIEDFEHLLERLGVDDPQRRERLATDLRLLLDGLETLPLLGDFVETIDALLARRQIHITLYKREDGGTDAYVHEEASSTNPFVAHDHYRAHSQNVELGVEWLESRLERYGDVFLIDSRFPPLILGAPEVA